MKDPKNDSKIGTYRPIACLNMIWKLFAKTISEKTYEHLNENELLPEEQKVIKGRCNGPASNRQPGWILKRYMIQSCTHGSYLQWEWSS